MSANPSACPVNQTRATAASACCLVVTSPPFYMVFEEMGEEAWERLGRERPDLMAELQADYHARQRNGRPVLRHALSPVLTPRPGAAGTTSTRPLRLSRIRVGGEDCRDARRRRGSRADLFARATSPRKAQCVVQHSIDRFE